MRLLRSIRLNWGLRPQTPGIYRSRARMACGGGGWSRLLPFRLLSRRSGCVPALPYPPLRYFQSGSHQPRCAMIFHRTATNPLTFCLTRWVHPRSEIEGYDNNGRLPESATGRSGGAAASPAPAVPRRNFAETSDRQRCTRTDGFRCQRIWRVVRTLASTAGCGKPHVRWCGRVTGRNPRHSTRSCFSWR